MNERYKELAEEAEKYADYHFKGEHFWTEAYEQKFAELIVREMLKICEEHPAWTARMIGEQIEEHFGVE